MKRILITLTIMMVALMCASAVAAADADNFDDMITDQGDNVDVSDIVIEDNTDEITVDDADIDETPIEDIEIEDNTDQTPVDDAVDNTVTEENASHELSRYEKINKFLNHDFEGIDKEDFLVTMHVYDEIGESYGAGYSVKTIADNVNMTPEQVQSVADTWYGEIKDDKIANAVYKLYGSHTLEEISDELGISTHKALEKIQLIKSGIYGRPFKRLFLVRDLQSLYGNNMEFVIN